MTASDTTIIHDDLTEPIARYVYEHAIEAADVDAPTADDRRRHEGGYVFDEDSWSYPSFQNVTDVELVEIFSVGMDSRHGRHHEEGSDPYLLFHGWMEGREVKQIASATYNPPSKAHPAEYDVQSVELHFTLSVSLSKPLSGVPLLTIERV